LENPDFVAGLRCDPLTAPWVVDTPMDQVIFETCVRTQLVPTLQTGMRNYFELAELNSMSIRCVSAKESSKARPRRLCLPPAYREFLYAETTPVRS
jgi:hypothetical protein